MRATLKPLLKNAVPHPVNEWMGRRYFTISGSREGVQRVAEC